MTATEERATVGFGRTLRKEDVRFVRGHGTHVDDVALPGMLHGALLRSPHAHARIVSVDTSAAQAHPKVKAVITGETLAGLNLAWVPRSGRRCRAGRRGAAGGAGHHPAAVLVRAGHAGGRPGRGAGAGAHLLAGVRRPGRPGDHPRPARPARAGSHRPHRRRGRRSGRTRPPAGPAGYPALAATAERLTHREFAALTAGELATLVALMRRLRLAPPLRRSRRTALGTRGPVVDLRASLRQARRTAPDWSGGTRIAAALREFTDRYGARGMARGAVLVIVSDGWETGDPAAVGRQLARLSKLAYRIVWANPRTAAAGYRPLAGGMAAAWPYCDAVVSAHHLAALDDLLAAIAGTALRLG